MLRLWDVSVTIVEDWEATAAVAVRSFEVLATGPADAERVLTEYLRAEYGSQPHEPKFDIREVAVSPTLCDMNAIRDGLVPAVTCTD